VAGAQASPRVALRWNAPDSCPDDGVLVSAVENLLGRRLADGEQQQLSVSIHVHGTPGGFAAKLVLTNAGGSEERFLEHPDCAKLVDAVALVTALAIDPEAVRARQSQQEQVVPPLSSQPPAPPPSPAPPPQVAAPTTVRVASSNASPPPTPPARALVMGVHGLIGAGSLPGVRPGFGAELGVRQRWFVAQAVARFWASGSADVPDAGPASVEMRLVSWGVRGCGLMPAGAWLVRPCVGADFGDLSGIGQNVANARARHDLLPSLEAGLAVAYARWQAAPLAGLALGVPLSRPSFGVLDDGVKREAFRPAALTFSAFFGLAYGL
jgi:hypothetical protein